MLSEREKAYVERIITNLVEMHRPEHSKRTESDLTYRIHDDSVVLSCMDENQVAHPLVKTIYLGADAGWQVYVMTVGHHWESFKSTPLVKTIDDFALLYDKEVKVMCQNLMCPNCSKTT